MLTGDFKKRVRYAETDKMGYLYYGHYAKYYEIGENAEGKRTCDTHYGKTSDEIRALVAEARAINS